jgi:alpha-beta hydrolase superfamily lysophospholipase
MHEIGYNTMLVDFRAHGNSEGNVSTIGYREANDVKTAYDYIRAKGEKNIVLWGVSLGAATIAHAVADYEVKTEKVILELSYGSLSAAAKGRIRTMGLPEQPIAGLLTFWGGTVRGFWAFGLKPEDYVKQMTCPVLVQHGAKDARVTRAESEAIFSNIPHPNKKLVVYETAKHESLCNREPEKWKREIKAFLNY